MHEQNNKFNKETKITHAHAHTQFWSKEYNDRTEKFNRELQQEP